jgi:hypothetical protein
MKAGLDPQAEAKQARKSTVLSPYSSEMAQWLLRIGLHVIPSNFPGYLLPFPTAQYILCRKRSDTELTNLIRFTAAELRKLGCRLPNFSAIFTSDGC